jgi:hypothetical protein
MSHDLSTKRGSIIFTVKYAGTGMAVLWAMLMSDLGIPWMLFFAILSYVVAVPCGIALWHILWRR